MPSKYNSTGTGTGSGIGSDYLAMRTPEASGEPADYIDSYEYENMYEESFYDSPYSREGLNGFLEENLSEDEKGLFNDGLYWEVSVIDKLLQYNNDNGEGSDPADLEKFL